MLGITAHSPKHKRMIKIEDLGRIPPLKNGGSFMWRDAKVEKAKGDSKSAGKIKILLLNEKREVKPRGENFRHKMKVKWPKKYTKSLFAKLRHGEKSTPSKNTLR